MICNIPGHIMDKISVSGLRISLITRYATHGSIPSSGVNDKISAKNGANH